MSNNHSIKILRGDRSKIISNANDPKCMLMRGQLLYNTTDNYLTVGDEDDTTGEFGVTPLTKKPIVVRELLGYWDDNSGITEVLKTANGEIVNGMWHIGPVDSQSKVEIRVGGKPLSITSDSSLNITQGDDSNDSNRYWKIYDSTDTTPELNILGNGQRVHVKSQNVTDDIAIYLETGSTNSIDLSGGSVVLHVKSTSGGQTTERTLSFINSTVGDGVDFGASQDNFYGASKKLIDAPALTASGNTITVTAGGQTSSAFTVPFATKASQLKVGTNTYYTFTKANAVPLTPASGTIYLIY